MPIKSPASIFIIIAILLLITSASLLFGSCFKYTEGFNTVPIATDPATKKIVYGYYQVDNENMAIIPYGFAIDPNNSRNIVPKTQLAHSLLKPKSSPPLPKPGERLADGFYFSNEPYLADSSLAVLPPNMRPNVNKIAFSDEQKPSLQVYYGKGYISETQYYNNKYTPNRFPSVLPEGVYYTDASKQLVSFLPYGQIFDNSKGYGFIPDTETNAHNLKYDDIENSYNTEFHDSEEVIKSQNDNIDLNFGEVRVKDQNGNILILPRVDTQGSTTYYQPGEFPFGASTYVPNYEDSVYLSSIGFRSMLGNVKTKPCDSICQAFNEFKLKMDSQCKKE